MVDSQALGPHLRLTSGSPRAHLGLTSGSPRAQAPSVQAEDAHSRRTPRESMTTLTSVSTGRAIVHGCGECASEACVPGGSGLRLRGVRPGIVGPARTRGNGGRPAHRGDGPGNREARRVSGAEVEAAPAAGPGWRFRPAGSGPPAAGPGCRFRPAVVSRRRRCPAGSDCRFRPPGPPSPRNAARRSGRYGPGEGDAPALGAGDPDGSGVAMGVGAGVGSGPSTGGKSTGIGSP